MKRGFDMTRFYNSDAIGFDINCLNPHAKNSLSTVNCLTFQCRQKTQQQSLRPLDYGTVSIARVAAQTVVKPGSGKNSDRTSRQLAPRSNSAATALPV